MSDTPELARIVAQWRSELARAAASCPDCTSDPEWMGFVRTGGREPGGQWHYRLCDHPRARHENQAINQGHRNTPE